MTTLTAKQKVLAVYPDAEVHRNDFYSHWIGRKVLSDGFKEDEDALDAAFDDREAPSEVTLARIKAIEDAADEKAWEDAASKIETPEGDK